jgi:hypothetical protein
MKKRQLFEEAGKMDPYGIMSDESYIRGMSSDNPEREKLMKKHNLKDDPNRPGVYGSSHKNFSERGYKEHR